MVALYTFGGRLLRGIQPLPTLRKLQAPAPLSLHHLPAVDDVETGRKVAEALGLDTNSGHIVSHGFVEVCAKRLLRNNLRDPGLYRLAGLSVDAGLQPASATHYHLWQRGYDSLCIHNIKMMRQKIDYLHANPVRAGIVDITWEYRYCSYRNYCGEKGLFEIDFIDLGIDDPTKPRRW